MATTTIVVEEDSGLESLSSCNEQPVQMENFVTLFIVVLNRKGEFDDAGEEEVLQQLRLFFDSNQSVWRCKQRILANLLEHTVRDPLNYGLYCPAANGRAGKFLDEERLIREYGLSSPAMLEFKYKRRVYKMMSINQRKLRQLHSKSTLRQFLDHVRHNNVERVNRLLMSGLDPNFTDPETGETPLSMSVGLPKPYDMICALFNGGAHVDFRGAGGLTPVHKAARCAAPVALKTLLELGAAANYRDQRGLTPLYHAVCQPRADLNCIDMLLRDRAQMNIRDEQQNTELHQACRGGHSSIVEHLLYYGSLADAQNAIGNTALHLAAIEGHEAAVRVLLFRGAQKEIRNSAQNTPYEVAVLAGHVDIAKIIAAHNPAEAVPYRDAPVYSQRRHQATPARMPLSRSSSDNRLAASFALANAGGANLSMAAAMSQSKRMSLYQMNSSAIDGNSGNNSTGDYASSSSPSTYGGGIYYATRLAASGELAISGGTMSGFPNNGDLNNSAAADFAAHNSTATTIMNCSSYSAAAACCSPVSRRSIAVMDSAEYSRRSLSQHPSLLVPNTPSLSCSRPASTVFVPQHRRVALCIKSYKTKSPFELALKKGQRVIILGPGEEGMFEGQDADSGRRGYFPVRCVREVGSLGTSSGANFLEASLAANAGEGSSFTLQKSATLSGSMSVRHRSRSAATLYAEDALSSARTVVIQRTPAGFGFVLKGPRASQPGQVEIEFSPTPAMPATQYLAVVEAGSVADRAGLKPKDYVLEIDGISVVAATHERCVDLIRNSADMLQLKVVTVSQATLNSQLNSSSGMAELDQSRNYQYSGGTSLRQMPSQAPPPVPMPISASNGVMTLSRHSQMRSMAPIEQLEMSLRGQLTLPRQLRQENGVPVRNGKVDQILARRTISAASELKQQQQPEHGSGDGESDYETIDDVGMANGIPPPMVQPHPANSAMIGNNKPILMGNGRVMVNVSDVDEATYSSQLEQMDSGNSSCSNNGNEEITSAGTLYANAGQLRRLYGVGDDSVQSSTESPTADGNASAYNDDSNYDFLSDDQRQAKVGTKQTEGAKKQQGYDDNNEDIYENDTAMEDAINTSTNTVVYKDASSAKPSAKQTTSGATVRPSVSFSARAEETRRAFLDQLQRPKQQSGNTKLETNSPSSNQISNSNYNSMTLQRNGKTQQQQQQQQHQIPHASQEAVFIAEF